MSIVYPRPHYRVTSEGKHFGVWLDVRSESGNIAGQLVCFTVYRTGALSVANRLCAFDGGLVSDLTPQGLRARPKHLKEAKTRADCRASGFLEPTVTPAPLCLTA